jgi:hypothetical protein
MMIGSVVNVDIISLGSFGNNEVGDAKGASGHFIRVEVAGEKVVGESFGAGKGIIDGHSRCWASGIEGSREEKRSTALTNLLFFRWRVEHLAKERGREGMDLLQ